jgi:hypothetical protein
MAATLEFVPDECRVSPLWPHKNVEIKQGIDESVSNQINSPERQAYSFACPGFNSRILTLRNVTGKP